MKVEVVQLPSMLEARHLVDRAVTRPSFGRLHVGERGTMAKRTSRGWEYKEYSVGEQRQPRSPWSLCLLQFSPPPWWLGRACCKRVSATT